jgi:putative ABC transport system permease protein
MKVRIKKNHKKDKNSDCNLSYPRIIYQNLTKQALRTLMMVSLCLILSFTIFSSSLLLKSMELGLRSTADRLGADIIIVPQGYIKNLQNALFLGEPCTIYFDKEWVDKIKAVEGVGKVSFQMFLATLSDSECCDYPLQIIAYDPATDFVVEPWIKQSTGKELSDYQIVIGSNLHYEPGDIAKFFGEEFVVAAKLEKTGMGYDNSVFLTYTTAYDLIQKPVVKNYFTIGNRENLISMITIETVDGYDIHTVIDNIYNQYGNDNFSVYASISLLDGISDNLKNFTVYGRLLHGLLLTSTIFSLLCIFGITMNERKREFGILKSLGASRTQILLLIIGEAEAISIFGFILGSISAGILIFSFQNFIIEVMKVPYLSPSIEEILLLTGKCLLISSLTGIVASVYSALKISRTQSCDLM